MHEMATQGARELGTWRPNEAGQRRLQPQHRSNNSSSEMSMLTVDKRTAHVGENVQVTFDIKSVCEAQDWIGLYLADDCDPNGYLEYRSRGLTGGRTGAISWPLETAAFASQPGTTAKVQFCYYHSNGMLEAISAPIIVTLPINDGASGSSLFSSSEEMSLIGVSGLIARDLKKKMFSRPDPVLRLRVVPGPSRPWFEHHEQQAKTHRCKSTCNPVWTGESFQFQVISSDVLEFTIKGKASGDSGFLGKATIQLKSIVTAQRGSDFALPLDRRFPGENISGVVSGRIDFSGVSTRDGAAAALSRTRPHNRHENAAESDVSDSDSDTHNGEDGNQESVLSCPIPPRGRGAVHRNTPSSGESRASSATSTSATNGSGGMRRRPTFSEVCQEDARGPDPDPMYEDLGHQVAALTGSAAGDSHLGSAPLAPTNRGRSATVSASRGPSSLLRPQRPSSGSTSGDEEEPRYVCHPWQTVSDLSTMPEFDAEGESSLDFSARNPSSASASRPQKGFTNYGQQIADASMASTVSTNTLMASISSTLSVGQSTIAVSGNGYEPPEATPGGVGFGADLHGLPGPSHLSSNCVSARQAAIKHQYFLLPKVVTSDRATASQTWSPPDSTGTTCAGVQSITLDGGTDLGGMGAHTSASHVGPLSCSDSCGTRRHTVAAVKLLSDSNSPRSCTASSDNRSGHQSPSSSSLPAATMRAEAVASFAGAASSVAGATIPPARPAVSGDRRLSMPPAVPLKPRRDGSLGANGRAFVATSSLDQGASTQNSSSGFDQCCSADGIMDDISFLEEAVEPTSPHQRLSSTVEPNSPDQRLPSAAGSPFASPNRKRDLGLVVVTQPSPAAGLDLAKAPPPRPPKSPELRMASLAASAPAPALADPAVPPVPLRDHRRPLSGESTGTASSSSPALSPRGLSPTSPGFNANSRAHVATAASGVTGPALDTDTIDFFGPSINMPPRTTLPDLLSFERAAPAPVPAVSPPQPPKQDFATSAQPSPSAAPRAQRQATCSPVTSADNSSLSMMLPSNDDPSHALSAASVSLPSNVVPPPGPAALGGGSVPGPAADPSLPTNGPAPGMSLPGNNPSLDTASMFLPGNDAPVAAADVFLPRNTGSGHNADMFFPSNSAAGTSAAAAEMCPPSNPPSSDAATILNAVASAASSMTVTSSAVASSKAAALSPLDMLLPSNQTPAPLMKQTSDIFLPDNSDTPTPALATASSAVPGTTAVASPGNDVTSMDHCPSSSSFWTSNDAVSVDPFNPFPDLFSLPSNSDVSSAPSMNASSLPPSTSVDPLFPQPTNNVPMATVGGPIPKISLAVVCHGDGTTAGAAASASDAAAASSDFTHDLSPHRHGAAQMAMEPAKLSPFSPPDSGSVAEQQPPRHADTSRGGTPDGSSENEFDSFAENRVRTGTGDANFAAASTCSVDTPPPPIPPRDGLASRSGTLASPQCGVTNAGGNVFTQLPMPSPSPSLASRLCLSDSVDGAVSQPPTSSSASPSATTGVASSASAPTEVATAPPLPPRDGTLPRCNTGTMSQAATVTEAAAVVSTAHSSPAAVPRPSLPPRPVSSIQPVVAQPRLSTSRVSKPSPPLPARNLPPGGVALPPRTSGMSTSAQPVQDTQRQPPYPVASTRPALPPLPPPPTRRSGTLQQNTASGTVGARLRPVPVQRASSRLVNEEARDASVVTLSAEEMNEQQRTSDPVANLHLPSNWEAREDQYGRTFFINHRDRVTTWDKPSEESGGDQRSTFAQQRAQLHRRYASMRRQYGTASPVAAGRRPDASTPGEETPPPPRRRPRTDSLMVRERETATGTKVAAGTPPSVTMPPRRSSVSNVAVPTSASGTAGPTPPRPPRPSLTAVGPPAQTPPTPGSARSTPAPDKPQHPFSRAATTPNIPNVPAPPATPAIPKELSSSPAVRFLLRQDFYTLVGVLPNSYSLFYDNRHLVEKVRRVRDNPALFPKFMHHKDLVAFINTFAQSDGSLPVGWERKLDKDGKAFFIDHNTRVTSYIDPRLPVPHAFGAVEERSPEPDAVRFFYSHCLLAFNFPVFHLIPCPCP